jgi:hypothetical protein
MPCTRSRPPPKWRSRRPLAAARREHAAAKRLFSSPSARSCFARAIKKAFLFGVNRGLAKARRRGVHARVSIGTIRLVPFDVASVAPGTSEGIGASFSLPVTLVVSARGRTARVPRPITFDVISVLVGRASVSVSTLNIGATFPAQREAHLFSLVSGRAVAASHTYTAVLE